MHVAETAESKFHILLTDQVRNEFTASQQYLAIAVHCDDADLPQAVGAAMLGVFTACGQMCVAAERLYVFSGIYDRFVAAVVERAGGNAFFLEELLRAAAGTFG